MPLLDHFHPPLAPRRSWESLHAMWAACLAENLNQHWLSQDYFAEVQTHIGAVMEVDVATFENRDAPKRSQPGNAATAIVQAEMWAPPAAALVMPAVFPETFQVRIFGTERGGLDLVAAIELVSPGNKDRPEERRAFAVKSASYLFQGVSLMVMDIVTTRQANLHNEMMKLLEFGQSYYLPAEAVLYAVAYRPVIRQEKPEIDVWHAAFNLRGTLPQLPLGLTHGLMVPVDFEATYSEACQRLRLP